jgi:hypothetical protein
VSASQKRPSETKARATKPRVAKSRAAKSRATKASTNGSPKTGARAAATTSRRPPKPTRSPERRPAEQPVITASRARATSKAPTLRPGRRRAALGRWFALAGTLVAVGVVIALIVSWANDGNTSLRVSETTPTTTTPAGSKPRRAPAPTPAPAAAAPAPAAAAPAKPSARTLRCDPIFGGGVPHAVTSSARDGDPAGCGEAHSVLLTALNGGSTSVGGWRCTTRPNGQTLAACTSAGGRRILARE